MNVASIITELETLLNDSSVPRSVHQKVGEVIRILQQEGELSIKVNRALQTLEGVTDDQNVPAFTRTQLFSIVSLLEVAV